MQKIVAQHTQQEPVCETSCWASVIILASLVWHSVRAVCSQTQISRKKHRHYTEPSSLRSTLSYPPFWGSSLSGLLLFSRPTATMNPVLGAEAVRVPLSPMAVYPLSLSRFFLTQDQTGCRVKMLFWQNKCWYCRCERSAVWRKRRRLVRRISEPSACQSDFLWHWIWFFVCGHTHTGRLTNRTKGRQETRKTARQSDRQTVQ